MFQIPESIPNISAGSLPAQIVEACKLCQAEPEGLLSWSLRHDAVTIILPDGRKVTFPISGRWINLPFPSAVDSPPAADHMPAVGAFEYTERYPQEEVDRSQLPVVSSRKKKKVVLPTENG